MFRKIGEQAKDACTSCPDLIRYFEKIKMVVNPVVSLTRSVVAAVIAETLLGCTMLVDPALPNVLRGGRIRLAGIWIYVKRSVERLELS